MADVQLENGYVRIANRLYEALLDADFTPTQFKILHTLVRLSFGWRRRSVTVSHGELAAAGGMSASGAFRSALHQLIAEGVIIQLERGTGQLKSTLAIEKDFTKWGRWAIAPERLAARYGTRPASHDELFDERDDAEGVPTAGGARTEAPGVPEGRQAGCLEAGTPSASKSLIGETVGTRKDSERQGKTEEQKRESAGAPAAEQAKAVTDLARMALAGLMGDVGMAKVEEFLGHRQPNTHKNWLNEFAILVGPGSQFLPADLDGALADALMLNEPVSGPHAIRAFCAKRRAERSGTPLGSGARLLAIQTGVSKRGEAVAEAGELVGRIRQLIDETYTQGSGARRFIRVDAVKAIGPDVYTAYTNVGGMGRFLSLDTKPEDIGFLIREFADHLERARSPRQAVG